MTTFLKYANGRVKLVLDGLIFIIEPEAGIDASNDENELVINSRSRRFVIDYRQVSTPATGSRDELIVELVTNFFNGESVVATVDISTLAKETSLQSLVNSGIAVKDGANLDAFSRLRVSNPTALFSVQQQMDNSPIQMESVVSGTGVAVAHDANTRMSLLSCTAGTGVCLFQSYQYVPYQPLKSQEIALTAVFGAGVAGAVVDLGYGDDDNGIFLRQNGASGLQIVRRTKTSGSVVEEVIDKANWNINPALAIDETKSIIFVLDLQFLGMGRVRCYFDYNGVLVPVHQFLNANNMTVPYMQTASLPVRMSISATTTAGTKGCYFKCAAVNSEGGFIEDYGYSFGTPVATATAANGAFTHILSLRPKTTFNSKVNRAQFILQTLEALVTGNNSIDILLVIGATFSVAPTFTSVNSNSAFEYGTGGTLSGNGSILMTTFCPTNGPIKQNVSQSLSIRNPITLDKAGAVRAAGTISVLVSGNGATSASRAAINFKEIR